MKIAHGFQCFARQNVEWDSFGINNRNLTITTSQVYRYTKPNMRTYCDHKDLSNETGAVHVHNWYVHILAAGWWLSHPSEKYESQWEG